MTKPPEAILLPSMLAPFRTAEDVMRVARRMRILAALRRAQEYADEETDRILKPARQLS